LRGKRAGQHFGWNTETPIKVPSCWSRGRCSRLEEAPHATPLHLEWEGALSCPYSSDVRL